MDPSSDGSLLAEFARGKREALAALISRHEAALLRHARALVGDRALAEDVVQDTFLRFVERPPTLPAESIGHPEAERAQLAAWLHKVTRNLCMDRIRSDARRRAREEERAAPEAVRREVEPAEEQDTRAAVERGLARLSADQREVLALRLFGERSYEEIAGITGKKIGTVGWLVSTGLRALSRELEPLLAIEGHRSRVGAAEARVERIGG